ncbi:MULTISPECIES: chitobiase/beta-hexosaminidase C-terminal domain-containing protein [Flavobacteriaceae]|uniref:chitobiase/beta-hexosaminidase C-terminal domain-containing protein n=1 Tax=Flavobacteriaceae TaxID=49546 RepID=UPI001492996E|nr:MULTISPECIES: chitobiase/beta-hexosaminidase C-terminal domain-containing protein [Allomuricauda]MDC6365931.1 chitobiase/beta-hexosaminidase C-terminal domain-containing protein [Muricauda sp. AC10]
MKRKFQNTVFTKNLSDVKSAALLAFLFVAMGNFGLGQSFLTVDEIQLSPPIVEVDSLLFASQAFVKMYTAEGASVHYTLDGSEVSKNSQKYTSPIVITSTAHIRAKAFHEDYKSSNEQELQLRKIKTFLESARIHITPNANTNYQGNGPKTLIDNKKGSLNFRKGRNWLGFQDKTVQVQLAFDVPITIEKIIISTLQDQGSWIFAPKEIAILNGTSKIGAKTLENSNKEENKKMSFIEVPVQKGMYNHLLIQISALEQIPDWHPGKGTLPWLFLDEILIE